MSTQTSRRYEGPLKYRMRTSVFYDVEKPKPSTKFIGNRREDLGFEPASDRRKRQDREASAHSERVSHGKIASETNERYFAHRQPEFKEEKKLRSTTPTREENLARARAELQESYKARFL